MVAAPPPRGFRRSRALWNQARLSRHDGSSRLESLRAYGRAVAYELQPIRVAQLRRGRSNTWNASEAWNQIRASLRHRVPAYFQAAVHFLRQRTRMQWLAVAGVVAYYRLVRCVHEWLHAGPIMLMGTLLAIICTVGLGDDANVGLSAYSVFNRGLRLLGDLQADDVVAQHVGWAHHQPRDDRPGGGGR